jgi:aldehyde dehydrogenase (NAD+)
MLEATGKVLTSVAGGSAKDVDRAVEAAKQVKSFLFISCGKFSTISKAYKTSWGLKCPGSVRGRLLNNLADLIEANIDEFAALEALDNGELFNF